MGPAKWARVYAMRFNRKFRAWFCAALLLGPWLGAEVLAAKPAEPNDYAKLPPPKIPAPPPLSRTTSFGPVLEPYRNVVSDEDRRVFQRQSEELFVNPAATALRKVAAWLAAERNKGGPSAENISLSDDGLFTYQMPNDPLILLGTAKSYNGAVTAPPRLNLDTFAPPKKPAAGAPGEPKDDGSWITANPEQVCTNNLSFMLPRGSMYSDLEYLPTPTGLDMQQSFILQAIESSPNPVLRSSEGAEDAPGSAPEAPADAPNQPVASTDSEEPLVTPPVAPAVDESGGFFDELRKKEMPLADFVNKLTKDANQQDQRLVEIAKELQTSVVPQIPAMKKRCAEAGGRFVEAKWTDGGALNLLSCFKGEKAQIGVGLRLLAPDGYPSGLAVFNEEATTEAGVELTLEFQEDYVTLGSYKKGEYFGPELRWSSSGEAMALNFHVPAAQVGRYGEYDVYEWHESGALKLLGHRHGGDPSGKEQTWYDSGALAGEVQFDDHGKITSYKEWFENHRPAEDTPLKAGAMHGTRRWWHQNGEPAGELAYDRGETTGPLMLWYSNGAKGAKTTFLHGELNGPLTWWYDDGGTMYEGRFAAGKPQGTHKVYQPNGKQLSERTYKAGEPDGAWVAFDGEGKAVKEVTFQNGQKQGKSVVRYPNGQTFLDVTWVNGAMDGALNSYYEDGAQAATCLYEKGNLLRFTRFYASGQPSLEGRMVNAESGQGQFAALRKDGSTRIECQLKNFETDGCRVFDGGGQEIALPSDTALARGAKRIDDGPKAVGSAYSDPVENSDQKPAKPIALAWNPGKCGGFTRHANYDSLINPPAAAANGTPIFVEYEAKGACPEGVAAHMTCLMNVVGGKLSPEPCSLDDQRDTSELQEIVRSLDQGAPTEDYVH